MSDPQLVFDAMDEHKVAVFALAGLAMLGNYIWFIAALRVAKQHRTYTIPLFLTFFWFAHDSSFVLSYDTWFNTYNHWFPQLFWALLILTVAFELAFMSQALKYGQSELAPSLTVWQFRIVFLGGVASMYIAWVWLKQSMDDPVYLDIFALTVLSYPCVAIMSVLRRGSRHGFSMPMCGGFLMMTVFYFSASTFFFGPEYQSTTYHFVGIASLLTASAMTWVVWKAPEYEVPAADPTNDRANSAAPHEHSSNRSRHRDACDSGQALDAIG